MTNLITLASADAEFEGRLRTSFATPMNGELRRVDAIPDDDAALDLLAGERGSSTEVVALGPGMNSEVALALARRFDAERPDVSVVLVMSPTAKLLQEALDAGVRGVLSPDAKAGEIRATFERAMTVTRQRRAATAPPAAFAAPAHHVVTVLSPKGGSGKTTTCVNLAVALAQRAPRQVVLVDLDLQFGDTASALQLQPEASIADVARSGDLGAAAVKVALAEHASGLYVLCAPESPVEAEEIAAAAVAGILDVLAQEFRYVIVDTNAGLGEHTLTAIEQSTDLVLVCSMDVPSIRALHKEVVALEQLGMTRQRRHLLLNRADSRVGLATPDVEALLGMEVQVQVPSSRTVPLSVNEGVPVVESDPRSAVSRQFLRLADRFLEVPASRAGGLLRRVKDMR